MEYDRWKLNCRKVLYPIHGKMEPVKRPSASLASWLALILGFLGIHNLSLHKFKRAFAQLAITCFSFGTLVFVPLLWGLHEAYKLTNVGAGHDPYHFDGRGTPLYSYAPPVTESISNWSMANEEEKNRRLMES